MLRNCAVLPDELMNFLVYHLSEWLRPTEVASCSIDYSNRISCHPQMPETLTLLFFKGGGNGDYDKNIIETDLFNH